MLMGAWKSFYELEDTLTLDELFTLYEVQMEDEYERFRREAQLQGVDLPMFDEEKSQHEELPQETFSQRVARRRAEMNGTDPNAAAGEAEFGEGVGYKLLGG